MPKCLCILLLLPDGHFPLVTESRLMEKTVSASIASSQLPRIPKTSVPLVVSPHSHTRVFELIGYVLVSCSYFSLPQSSPFYRCVRFCSLCVCCQVLYCSGLKVIAACQKLPVIPLHLSPVKKARGSCVLNNLNSHSLIVYDAQFFLLPFTVVITFTLHFNYSYIWQLYGTWCSKIRTF